MRPEASDYLFVTTEKERYAVLAYDGTHDKVHTVESGDLHDRACRPIERGQILCVDGKSQVLAIHMVQGLVKLMGIEGRRMGGEPVFTPPVNRRIDELQVIDMQMLLDVEQPTLAVMHHTIGDTFKISTYVVVDKGHEKDLSAGPWSFDGLDYGSYLLIAVPSPKGGIIAVSDEALFYYNPAKKAQCALSMNPCRFTCYCRIDDSGYRYLLSDTNGGLFVLILFGEEDRVEALKLEYLGQTVIASTLTYLDNGYVYVGSHYGDAQIVELSSSRLPDGNFVSVVDTLPCSAPLVDFITADVENIGQSSVIACSGAFKEGALRFIRKGSNLVVNATAALDSSIVLDMFAMHCADIGDVIFLSTLAGTKILCYREDSLEELDRLYNILSASQSPSIFVGQLGEETLVQVTADEAVVGSLKPNVPATLWRPTKGGQLRFVAHFASHLVLSTDSQELYWFDCEALGRMVLLPTTFAGSEICALALVKVKSEMFVAVALWGETKIRFIDPKNPTRLADVDLDGSVAVRALHFATLDRRAVLFVGLGDGTVVHCFLTLDGDTKKLAAMSVQRVTLGTSPVQFFPTFVGLFACADKPFLVSMKRDRVAFSLTNVKNVKAIAGLAKSGEILIARDDDLLFCKLDSSSKFHLHHHVQPMGQTVTRIADMRRARALVTLGSSSPCPSMADFASQEDSSTSRVILVDRETLLSIDAYEMPRGEKAHSLTRMLLDELGAEVVIVGTALVRSPGQEPEEGRILTFVVNGDRRLRLVSQTKVPGCVYAMAPLNQPGRLVAAINGMTSLYKWARRESGGDPAWVFVHSHFGQVLGIKLDVRGDLIAVGDLMKSVNLLRVDEKGEGLVELARDFDPNWITEVRFLSDDEILGADNLGNLFVLRKQRDVHFSGGERWTLRIKSGFHLGEIVNKIEAGTLARSSADQKQERLVLHPHLIATTSGAVYLLGKIHGPARRICEVLQENLRKVLPPIGELAHGEWRAVATERRRPRSDVGCFLDGDLLAKFLDLDGDVRKVVAEGGAVCDATGTSVVEVTKLVENLVSAFQ